MGAGGGLSPYSFTYDSATDSYILSAHTCFQNLFTLTIPSSNEGKPVTSIGPSALAYCNTLEKVDIPSTITSIGANAFIDCVNLNALNFYGNQPVFGSNVFGLNSVNAKIYRIPGKNWNTYFIQGRPVELFYPENYVIKNQIRTGGLGKITLSMRSYDPDASAYITAVEIADGQPLELNVKAAINSFVIDCKTDGIWDGITSCCILAGARTLNGALTPLKGVAPTNNNFIPADYNRATGLKGNGHDVSFKYIDTNRNDNQDDLYMHRGVYVGEPPSLTRGGVLSDENNANFISLRTSPDTDVFRLRSTTILALTHGVSYPVAPGFFLMSKNSDPAPFGTYIYSFNQHNIGSQITASAINSKIYIGGRNRVGPMGFDGRVSFYTIGNGYNLTQVINYNKRIRELMNAFSTLT